LTDFDIGVIAGRFASHSASRVARGHGMIVYRSATKAIESTFS
jgi:hypothetical protein